MTAGVYTDTTTRIMRILVDCGMIASEELEIVRCLIQKPASARDCSKPEAVIFLAGQESQRSLGR